MLKEFIKECLFFQSKEELHIGLGIFSWVNIIVLIISVIKIIDKLL